MLGFFFVLFFYMRLTQDKLCDYQLVIYLFSIQLIQVWVVVVVAAN